MDGSAFGADNFTLDTAVVLRATGSAFGADFHFCGRTDRHTDISYENNDQGGHGRASRDTSRTAFGRPPRVHLPWLNLANIQKTSCGKMCENFISRLRIYPRTQAQRLARPGVIKLLSCVLHFCRIFEYFVRVAFCGFFKYST